MKKCKKELCDFFDEDIQGCERPEEFKICVESVEKVEVKKDVVSDVVVDDIVSDSDDE